MSRKGFSVLVKMAVVGTAVLLLAGCAAGGEPEQGCSDREVNVAFFAFFPPVSYSADPDPAAPGFNTHLGYEADLLTAIEAMEGPTPAFSRKGIAEWGDIWAKSAEPEFDLAGGGITILESRTLDAAGAKVVKFTSGHINFQQSLLVRAEDEERLADYADLTADVRVGVLADTTGEARLLELTGLVDDQGVLAAGTRVETPMGEVIADGSAMHGITAAGESAGIEERQRLYPPSEGMPQVVYLGEEVTEAELLDALASGEIDALARGVIESRSAASVSGGKFVVSALDEALERGGFTVDADDDALLSCLNERIGWLTDDGGIGFAEWLGNPAVFMERAETWDGGG